MLKFSEVSNWEKEVVRAKVTELRTELFSLKMEKGVSGIEKPHMIKEHKRDIARLLTVLNAKGEK